jgi:hypothetical protein
MTGYRKGAVMPNQVGHLSLKVIYDYSIKSISKSCNGQALMHNPHATQLSAKNFTFQFFRSITRASEKQTAVQAPQCMQ